MSLMRASNSTLLLRFEGEEQQLHIDSTSVSGFSRLVWEGMTLGTGHEGCPDLPSLSTLVRLPKGSGLTVEEVRHASTGWRDAVPDSRPLAPVTEGWFKDGLQPDYHPNRKVYQSDGYYRGGERVEVENLGVMGMEQVYRVTVRPVCYQPVWGHLEYDNYIDATLKVAEAEPVTPSNILLVVSRPQFREGLQPFVRWKRQEGYEVVELYADTHKRDSIKEMIGSQWPTADGRMPRYMLLVGDVAQLQAYLGTTHPSGLGNHVTDLYYAELTGDYLPDALVGRWPVNDTAELGAVVRKTLSYEQFRDIDTTQLKRVLLVAGAEEQQPAPITTNGQVNYVGREVCLTHPFLDTLCYRNPASDNQRGAILDDLSQGAAWLNYTAHCTTAGWSRPSVTFSSLDTLDNSQPLLYINNCCLSNAFDGTCFGEQLLRKVDGGAIGVIGATNSTLWNEDYYWAVGPKYPFSLSPVYDAARPGAFDCWVGQNGGVQTLGELLAAGNLSVTAFGSPYDKFYWETYCLLGDPTLRPWVGVPQTLEFHATNGLNDGTGSVALGGTPRATVTVMQHDTVLGTGTIGDNGLVLLELSSSLDTTPLIVTASGAGYRPRVDTLMVEAVAGFGAALREVEVTDSTVHCRVENVGTVPLYGLRIVLSQLEVDSVVDALLAEQMEVVDTLLPHQSRAVELPVEVTTIGQHPWWQAQFFAWDSTEGMLCSLRLSRYMNIEYPSVTFRLLEADGSEAHSLLSQHSYIIETTVDGGSPDVGLSITALPSGDTLTALLTSLTTLHSPLSTPDTLTHLHLKASLRQDNYRSCYDYYLVGGQRMESFEEGFDSYPWQPGGTQPWQLDSTVSHCGRFSARSGPIEYRQTSDLCLDVLLPQSDTLSFWVNTSCEANYDKLVLLVDGVRRGNEMWGIRGWRRYATVLAAGPHRLCWRYVKDESGAEGEDCVWIDDVRLPLALWDSAYGWFGDTATLDTHTLDAQSPTGLRVFPNPSNGTVTVDGVGDGTLRVLDLYGREVYSTHHTSPSTYRLPDLPDGLYLLQMVTSAGSLFHTLVIRH